MPDEVATRLQKLAAEAGLPLSTFALQELTESARRAENANLLGSLSLCRSIATASWKPSTKPEPNDDGCG